MDTILYGRVVCRVTIIFNKLNLHGIHTPVRTPCSITWQTSEQSVISVSLLFSELGAPADCAKNRYLFSTTKLPLVSTFMF